MSDDAAINRLLIERHPEAYPNDDGDIVVERYGVKYQNGERIRTTYELNLTTIFRTAKRTTGHIDHLVIEAELAADGRELDNPAVPINEQTEKAARERIEKKGLTPAWEAADGR